MSCVRSHSLDVFLWTNDPGGSVWEAHRAPTQSTTRRQVKGAKETRDKEAASPTFSPPHCYTWSSTGAEFRNNSMYRSSGQRGKWYRKYKKDSSGIPNIKRIPRVYPICNDDTHFKTWAIFKDFVSENPFSTHTYQYGPCLSTWQRRRLCDTWRKLGPLRWAGRRGRTRGGLWTALKERRTGKAQANHIVGIPFPITLTRSHVLRHDASSNCILFIIVTSVSELSSHFFHDR